MTGPIVGILLAAGNATRFGADKLAATANTGTAIGLASAAHLAAVVAEMIVVVRAADSSSGSLFRDAGWRTVVATDAALGMGHSLACGVRHTHDAAGWVIALADMPDIQPATIAAVVSALEDGQPIVVPRFAGRVGHPVGFGARHGAALAALTGDAGARSVVRAHADAVCYLDCDDAGIVLDLDTRADLERYQGRVGKVS